MEYCPLGDLQSYMSAGHFISMPETKQIASQVFAALEQMHINHFVHRDLKPGVGRATFRSTHENRQILYLRTF
jgi:serine/threonine protein kinase